MTPTSTPGNSTKARDATSSPRQAPPACCCPAAAKILLGRLPGDAKTAITPHRGLDGDWQQLEVIVRGNTMVHMPNGQVMSITIDDDPAARAPQGILSLQLEGSGQIWYRNVFLKAQDRPLEFPR